MNPAETASPFTPHASTEAVRSPWELTVRRFTRHRLGIASFFLLCVLYVVALFCEFFAPTTREWQDQNHSYCPPQPVHFNWHDGLHVAAMRRLDNPVTFARTY